MNVNLDDKRIMKIIYQLEDGSVVAYSFKNGELWTMQTLSDYYERKDVNETPTDREMIERIRTSEFMNELEDARKRFKLSKEIADTFPDKEIDGTMKPQDRKYSDESLDVVKEIIKMDRDGRLDEILKRCHAKGIDKFIREETESPLRDSELSDDSTACQKNMNTIEAKILTRLRMNDNDATKDESFNKLLEDYNFYKTKKKEIDDKIWESVPKV